MANNDSADDYMKATNYFVNKNLPRWNAFFHKLMTGEEYITNRGLPDMTVEDLMDVANQTLTVEETVGGPILKTQYKLIKKLLNLEKEFEGWTEKKSKKKGEDISIWSKTFKGNIIFKLVAQINAPLIPTYEVLKNSGTNKELEPLLKEANVLDTLSESLSILRSVYSFPWLDDRSLVFLKFTEILPEEGFGFIGFHSIERDDVALGPKEIRATGFGGNIIRSTGPSTCSFTHFAYGDFKGVMKKLPLTIQEKSLMKAKLAWIDKIKPMIDQRNTNEFARLTPLFE